MSVHPNHQLLLDLTPIPTAAGREDGVIEFVRAWVAARGDLAIEADRFGNLHITRSAGLRAGATPLVVVAHMDHPAFVVEEVRGDGELRLSFRGGVKDPYFSGAPITVFTADGGQARAVVRSYTRPDPKSNEPWGFATASVQGAPAALGIGEGDIARWEMGGAEIAEQGRGPVLLRTPACDNLASVCAALAMLDELRAHNPGALATTSVFLTRAEEIGFVGAICACREGTVPDGARVLVLENSRSFADSPIGAGVILRVGDRISVFSNAMSGALGRLAHEMAEESKGHDHPFRWQRKLMPGGACEASVFMAYGYESACLCHPLGNYHNMAMLDEVDAGEPSAIEHARCAREYIALSDYDSMVRLLVAAAGSLEEAKPLKERLEQYYEHRRFVVEEASDTGRPDAGRGVGDS